MEQFERIRRDHRDEELSIRELASRHRVHRRTVRAALADAVPPERKVPDRPRPVSGPWESTVRSWLEADLSEPRKQRHTARRVWQRLLDEKGARVAESTIRALVHDLKIEIGADRGLVAVPQTHLPGRDAEVDFGDFIAVIDGRTVAAAHVRHAVVAFGARGAHRVRQRRDRGVPGRARAGVRDVRRGADR